MEKILSENEMWQAVVNNDEDYDGIFYYGVKTTKIFCRPSCNSKAPKYENVSFFTNTEDALKNGFRPCKRCKPDMFVSYKEDLKLNVIDKINNIIEQEYDDPDLLEKLHLRIGFSRFHLHRIYKKETGCTPRIFLRNIRIKRAEDLINAGKTGNSEICYAVGFKSSSCFYEAFKAVTGLTPSEYKQKRWEEGINNVKI